MKIGAKYYKLTNSFLPWQTYSIQEVVKETPKGFEMSNGDKIVKSKGFVYAGYYELTPEKVAEIKENRAKNEKFLAVKAFASKIAANGFKPEQLLEMYDKLKELM